MAESTRVAVPATLLPKPADIARAENFAREQFVQEGESPEEAIGPGTPRRRPIREGDHDTCSGQVFRLGVSRLGSGLPGRL